MRRSLLFVHIQKAAGTSMRQVVARQYPKREVLITDEPVTLTPEQRRTLRVVIGHVPFDTASQLASPVDVITMLRQPVDRVVSFYYYFLRRPRHETLVAGKSLEEFAASGFPGICNQQVRQIAGRHEPDLATAKHNLAREVAAFGIAERFDESLVLMKRAVGWGDIYYRRLNVTANRPALRDIPRSAIARIERENELDLELYDFAVREFQAVIDAQDEQFHRELARLRHFNPLYGAISERAHAAARYMPGGVRRGVRAALTLLRGRG